MSHCLLDSFPDSQRRLFLQRPPGRASQAFGGGEQPLGLRQGGQQGPRDWRCDARPDFGLRSPGAVQVTTSLEHNSVHRGGWSCAAFPQHRSGYFSVIITVVGQLSQWAGGGGLVNKRILQAPYQKPERTCDVTLDPRSNNTTAASRNNFYCLLADSEARCPFNTQRACAGEVKSQNSHVCHRHHSRLS